MPNPEQDLLLQVLAQNEPLLQPGAKSPRLGAEEAEFALLSTALLRRALTQAQAIAALSSSPVPEAAVCNLRSMLEAFGDYHFLMTCDDPILHARIARIYSLREALRFAVESEDSEQGARLEDRLSGLSAQFPEAAQHASRRQNSWTTKGRRALVAAAIDSLPISCGLPPVSVGKELYRISSWDAHHVMAVALVINDDVQSPQFGTVKKQDAPEKPESFIPFIASIVLIGMFKQYLERFPEVLQRDYCVG